jgi:hypothetical protein
MFGGQSELLTAAAHKQIRIAPPVQLARTAQSLTRPGTVRVLAGMVDEDDRNMESALQLPQEGEQSGDLAGIVFVKAVQPDHRIEDEQRRMEGFNGGR